MERDQLNNLLESLVSLPKETDWVEFKMNNGNPDSIGKYVSALANCAILCVKERAYFVLGVDDLDHSIVGTEVRLATKKIGNEDFLLWLPKNLSPRLTIEHRELDVNGLHVEFLIVSPAFRHPVRFKNCAYIRVDSNLQKLDVYPDRESTIWQAVSRYAFERQKCLYGLNADVLKESFFIDKMASKLKQSSTSITSM
ncbi:helix-turn-helix domain-containing protein [Granulosicoccus antarcticus]|uniref:Schlafen AlbA-2 domain-containing protein n=1 Tax=Granulosicoccus antarcticus IMCC3135 TaxID=1192854 RepID=A0A2Z2P987_9GAMM|nr:ATP-binding protein [Granulosicoccus antarcticus]ASJ76454.1 hypothetical protein IMCC3135_32035 [Granulosicoccus antarcticus IMCC3135]